MRSCRSSKIDGIVPQYCDR